MANSIRAVEIGPGKPEYKCASANVYLDGLENLEIVTLDADPALLPDILHDIRDPFPEEMAETFDIVFCSHVLEHIEYMSAGKVLKNLASLLRVGGEMHVVVPDLSWACQKVLKGEQTIATAGVFWGGQADELDCHKSGYTLNSLRLLMEVTGLITRRAYQNQYKSFVTLSNGKTQDENVRQNYVIGLKV